MRSDSAIAGSIFAGALAVRVLHLQQVVQNDPFYLRPTVDSLAYHEWGSRLAAGDWLGSEPFFMSPLYGYGLGALFAVTGPSHFWPLVLNVVLGAATCAIVYSLSCRLFGRAVALVAAGLVAFYGMALFYEGSVLVESTQMFLTAAIALSAVRALEEPGARRFAWLGGLVGLSILARENTLLFALPFAACAYFALSGRLEPRRRAGLVALFAAVAALCVLPATVRNWAASHDLVLVNSTGGIVLYTGWNPEANGVYTVPSLFPRALADDPVEQKDAYRWLAEQRTGERPLAASQVSSYWRDQAVSFVREHPARAIALALWKARLFWSAFEA
ncbi:MAG: ArnT family glycosyltransferase, partial [bacterium]